MQMLGPTGGSSFPPSENAVKTPQSKTLAYHWLTAEVQFPDANAYITVLITSAKVLKKAGIIWMKAG